MYGGLNIFKYTKEKVTVKPIKLNRSTFSEFQKKSLLFRIGNRKHSVNILQKQINNIDKSKNKTLNALHTAKNLALEMNDALKNNDLEKFNEIINEGWKIKKQFAAGITNPRIEKISKEVIKNGAQSLKVTGAGGGGHGWMGHSGRWMAFVVVWIVRTSFDRKQTVPDGISKNHEICSGKNLDLVKRDC